jgi:sulfite exporter TauE/SafE
MALAVRAKAGRQYLLGRLVFNLGRTLSYMVLGLLVGLLGHVGSLVVPKQAIALSASGLMVVVFFWPHLLPVVGFGHGPFAKARDYFFRFWERKSVAAQGITGILNGLLPCGMVYLALAGSLAMPDIAESVGFMAAFGAGTLPLLLAIAVGSQPLHKLATKAPYLQPALTLSVAAFLLFRGFYPSETAHTTRAHHAQPSTILLCKKP